MASRSIEATALAAFVIHAFVAGGCWVKKEVGKQMQADIVALQTEFEVAKKAHTEQRAELVRRLDGIDKRSAELKLTLEEYRRITGRNAADFGVEIQQVKRHATEMRGQVEVNGHRLEVIEKRLRIIHDDLSSQKAEALQREEERLKKELEERQKAEEAAKKKLPEIKRPAEQEEFYKLAHGMIEAGQYKAARILFEEFLEKWPRGSYSDNAQYWIGESYYAQQNYRSAALTFQRVRKEFPRSDKAPDALLKLGYCFFAMGMYRESLPFLKEFVQSNPKSPLTKKAKKKIREAEKKLR